MLNELWVNRDEVVETHCVGVCVALDLAGRVHTCDVISCVFQIEVSIQNYNEFRASCSTI